LRFESGGRTIRDEWLVRRYPCSLVRGCEATRTDALELFEAVNHFVGDEAVGASVALRHRRS
jgi:hypothetical protein